MWFLLPFRRTFRQERNAKSPFISHCPNVVDIMDSSVEASKCNVSKATPSYHGDNASIEHIYVMKQSY